MKSLFKVALLSSAMVLALSGCDDKKSESSTPSIVSATAAEFKTEAQKEAYAMGASFGGYLADSFQSQDVSLDGEMVIKGFSDSFKGESLLTKDEIQQVMMSFQTRMMEEAKVKQDKEAAQSFEEGNKYRAEFEKQKGVHKTASGLLYKIEKEGTGRHPTPDDIVVVNYKGTLVDGKEFDSSYSRNEPTTFQLSGVIPGWTEGLQLISVGGVIKLVIPAELAYGDNSIPGGPDRVGIPAKSTLVFEVELVDIQEDK